MSQIEEYGKFIRELMPKLAAHERLVAREIYNALARSGAISLGTLAERTGLNPSRVEATLSPWPGVYRDDRGDIIGFWGLTGRPISKHVLSTNGHASYAWCAWDCLFLPAVLGRPVNVSSVCAQTGEPIELLIGPSSVERVEPASTVLSMLRPDLNSSRQDVISTFCHFIHFFRDEEAAGKWTATHPGTSVITLDQGMELGRIKNAWQFGEGAATAVTPSPDGSYMERGHCESTR
jgi:alkylmercury lyase